MTDPAARMPWGSTVGICEFGIRNPELRNVLLFHHHLLMPAPRFTRTRLAPTPSGFLHLGNAASFLLTSELARKHGSKVLLRIDDLDRERVRPEYVQDIFDTLNWLGITWDEGPRDAKSFERTWSQVHRRDLYAAALDKLRDAGMLFACTCSRSQLAAEGTEGYSGTCLHRDLPLDTPGAAWRIRTGENIPPSVRHAIVRKKNGDAAYQLASVVDDLQFGIDLVVRGEDLHDSTLVQQYIAEALGESAFAAIRFYHHPLMTGPDGQKMSKSAGDTSIKVMIASGATREDIMSLFKHWAGLLNP
jgi:glutamyl-tRNA synthetase